MSKAEDQTITLQKYKNIEIYDLSIGIFQSTAAERIKLIDQI